MSAKKCIICNQPFSGRRDAKTCSPRCRKRLQLVRMSVVMEPESRNMVRVAALNVSKPAVLQAPAPLEVINSQTPVSQNIVADMGKTNRKMKGKRLASFTLGLFGILSLLLALLPSPAARAATSSNLNFQARLLTNTGAVVPDGSYNVEFKIYKSLASGTSAQGVCAGGVTDDCLWLETRTGGNTVSVVNGYLSVNLGSVNAFGSINWDQPLWLSMRIGGIGTPSWDAEMSPRIALTALPYSFVAGQLAKTDGSSNRGTLSFNTVANNPAILLPDASGTVCLQSASACGFESTSGTDFIQNRTASVQTSSNFWISGNGIADTALQAPNFDAATSNTALGIGTTNAAAITIGNVTNSTVTVKTKSSTAAFQVQNASGGSLLNVDSTNGGNLSLLGNNSAELSSWTTTTAIPTTTVEANQSVVVNGYIYSIGGLNGSTAQNTVRYARLNADGTIPSSGTGTWATTTVLPVALNEPGVATYNSYIYVAGGTTTTASAQSQNTVYYGKVNADGTISSWTLSPNTLCDTGASQNRWDPVTLVVNGYLYVISGMNSSSGTINSSCFAKINPDGSISSFTKATSVGLNGGSGVMFSAGATANGYIYVVGSNISGTYSNNVFYAKPTSTGDITSWTTGTAFPVGLSTTGAFIANGYIYAVSGNASAGVQATIYYAPINADGSIGTWVTATNTTGLSARGDFGWTQANGYFYMLGGNNGTTSTSTVQYASTARIRLTGAIDLVGLSGENLNTYGSASELTAGNIRSVGNLQVQGSSQLWGNLMLNGDLTAGGAALFKNSTNSATAFQVQNAAGTSLLTADTTNTRLSVNANVLGNATATATTATTSGTGTNTTTLTLTAGAFANGDVIFIDNAGQDYFTRITGGGGTATLTVDPAVTFENARTVTKYTVQYLGSDGSNFTGATRNQNSFYQGYFLGGVVTGAGSTVYSDTNIQSANNLRINTSTGVSIQGTNSTTAFLVQNAAGTKVLGVDTINSQVTISNSGGNSSSDEFNTGSSPGSQWTLYTDDASTATISGGNLVITPVATSSHDCWTGGTGNFTNCLRLVEPSPTTTGDIQLDTKLVNVPGNNAAYVGIIAWQDATNFLRFEYDSGAGFNFHAVLGGTGHSFVFSCTAGGPPIYMRVIRQGNLWTLYYSTNGVDFFTCGSIDLNITFAVSNFTLNNIGVDVVKDATSWTTSLPTFDYFRVSSPSLSVVGGIQFQEASDGNLLQANDSGGASILSLKESDSNWNLIANSAARFKNSTDSTTSFQIQNSSGVSLFTVDTTNTTIALGSASSTPVLLVLGNKNTSGDPTCTNGAMYYNSNSNQFRFCQNGSWTNLSNGLSAPSYVTSLPGSPSNGQEIYYSVSTGITWHLRYNSTNSNWEYLGGSPLTVYVSTSQSASSTGTDTGYVDLTTTGPSITLPLAGTYTATFGAQASPSGRTGGAGSAISNFMKLNINGSLSGPDAEADTQVYSGTGTMSINEQIVQSYQFTVGSASIVVKAQYRAVAPNGTGSFSGVFANRYVTIVPVTVQ